jgi:hypothetical protein
MKSTRETIRENLIAEANQPRDPQLPDSEKLGGELGFQEFHNEMRKYRRRVFIRKDWDGHTPIVREPASGEVKGKAAKRAAKRARVAELKAKQ